jgi:hypothetical protein
MASAPVIPTYPSTRCDYDDDSHRCKIQEPPRSRSLLHRQYALWYMLSSSRCRGLLDALLVRRALKRANLDLWRCLATILLFRHFHELPLRLNYQRLLETSTDGRTLAPFLMAVLDRTFQSVTRDHQLPSDSHSIDDA